MRERLRQAQQAETEALHAVDRAMAAEARARAKRDTITAAASLDVERTHQAVSDAHDALVQVSGLDRAAALLGIGRRELRRALASRPAPEGDGHDPR
jgi:hypothetical protein